MIPLLQNAVDKLSSFPTIGRRTALMLALYLLRQPEQEAEAIAASLVDLRKGVRYCKICNMISEGEICHICSDSRRDHSLICVVESIRDVMCIEDTGEYGGCYHVLGGVISPMDGIGPDDLHIDSLLERASSGKVREVILAIGKGMEGETTAFYINKLLLKSGVAVSTIARGVGFGADLEYTDAMTLGLSIKNRVPFE
ncbi:MAG TPA: recombination protein RecR [Candidatus Coprenecus stercoripullorum]|nr:recombination protein RecR [Candidatus Coprenecus stercoripullorum]